MKRLATIGPLLLFLALVAAAIPMVTLVSFFTGGPSLVRQLYASDLPRLVGHELRRWRLSWRRGSP